MKMSEKYRAKALHCEKLSAAAKDDAIKSGWSDIAIEWHCLAYRTAQESRLDRELERN